jgi:histidinol dehydrogenase
MPVTLSHDQPDFEAGFTALMNAKREASTDVDAVVADIIADVRARGVEAVIDLTRRFDRLELTTGTLAFSPAEIDTAIAAVPQAERTALELAAARIRAYHERQLPNNAQWDDDAGVRLGWRWSPVDAAGLYVPGGLASYPSSVLMNAIPAQVAGVQRLVICAPTPGGEVNPLVLLAARLSGVETVYRIGGAQAIAAMAYGAGPDHRAGQCLCGGGQAPGLRPGRHRHDRRSVRDPCNRRPR